MGRDALYIVSIDEYKTTEMDENALASDNWYQDARFKPLDETIARTMSVDEELIWRAINAKSDKNGPNHVLVSAKSAGGGKSHLLNRFRSHFPNSDACQLIVTAPTGIAAINIDGETIHRALGLGLADDSPVELFRTITKNRFRYAKTWKFLMDTRVLIIDELSMVTPALFQVLDYLFRSARGSSLPFGGVILIMFGDFCQLPSIQKNQSENQVKYVFQTEVWCDMNKCRIFLNRNYRQKDAAFIKALEEVRFGRLSKESELLLKTRIVKKQTINDYDETKIEPINIYATKKTVEEWNTKKLLKVCKTGKPTVFQPHIFVAPRNEFKTMNPKDAESGKLLLQSAKTLEDRFPLNVVEVCENAQVMMRCNFYHTFGVVNGTLGLVKKVGPEMISVLFYVKGKFLENPIDILRYTFRSKHSQTVDLCLSQFPICSAWATTIHKVQGLTLDKLHVNPFACFEFGQTFVSISRCREIEDLTLANFDRSNIKTDPIAVKFENILEELEDEETDELQEYEELQEEPVAKKCKK
jgi:ATP-dependent DNA helicase PIF1